MAAEISGVVSEQISDRKTLRTVCLVLTATFVVYADVAIVNVAAPMIERTLRASVTDLELIVAGYQIAFAATLVTGGRLADILGCRNMFIIAFSCFVVTSAACGLAGSAGQLIAFRILQGVSAALLAPQVVATIQVALPAERRSGAFAALGAVISIASIAGPLIGGFLIWANILGLGWRPIFFVNVPIGVIAIVLAPRLIPTFSGQEARKLDFTGTLLVVALLMAIMIPLTLGQLYGWPSWAWLCLVAAVVLGPIFLWSQRWSERRGRDPLLPSILWRDKAFKSGFLLYFVLFSGVVAFFLYYSILAQTGYRITALWVAITAIPFGVATAFFSTISGRLVRRWGGRQILAFGTGVCGIGFLSLLWPVTQVRGSLLAEWTIPSQVVIGAGLGLVIAPLLGVVLAGIPSSAAGAASGLLSVAQVTGGAIGVGLMGVLFQSQLDRGIVSATASQLRSGMTYSLLYNPVTFGLSALIIITLLRPAQGSRLSRPSSPTRRTWRMPARSTSNPEIGLILDGDHDCSASQRTDLPRPPPRDTRGFPRSGRAYLPCAAHIVLAGPGDDLPAGRGTAAKWPEAGRGDHLVYREPGGRRADPACRAPDRLPHRIHPA
jgi:EmrB/QacA subfamily drug resistance transporter